MITGPEHFRAAEQMLDQAAAVLDTDALSRMAPSSFSARAQSSTMATAHAPLAVRRGDRAERRPTTSGSFR
jgi:hypothetical protein